VYEETPPRVVRRVIVYDDRYKPIRLSGLSSAGDVNVIPGLPAPTAATRGDPPADGDGATDFATNGPCVPAGASRRVRSQRYRRGRASPGHWDHDRRDPSAFAHNDASATNTDPDAEALIGR